MPILVLPCIFPLIVSPLLLCQRGLFLSIMTKSTLLTALPNNQLTTTVPSTIAFLVFIKHIYEQKWLLVNRFSSNANNFHRDAKVSAHSTDNYSTTKRIRIPKLQHRLDVYTSSLWFKFRRIETKIEVLTGEIRLASLASQIWNALSSDSLNRQLLNNQTDSNPETSASFRCIYK